MALSTKKVVKVTYDFSVDAGAVGAITLDANEKLPVGAIVTNIVNDERTAFTSGGSATVQLKSGSIALTDAIAFDSGFTGVETQALASSATGIKITASADCVLTVATAALTAGVVDFYIEYYF
jgi:lysozyme family protein